MSFYSATPFCSLFPASWSLLLRLDSARVPRLWLAREEPAEEHWSERADVGLAGTREAGLWVGSALLRRAVLG